MDKYNIYINLATDKRSSIVSNQIKSFFERLFSEAELPRWCSGQCN